MKYVATVINKKGKEVKIEIEARSIERARTEIKKEYVSIKKITLKEKNTIDLNKIIESINPITVKDLAIFSRQFAAMNNAGVSLLRCLNILENQSGNPRLKRVLNLVKNDIQSGINLSDAMSKHPECFDNLYVSMIQAGEIGGVLDEILNRLAMLLEQNNKTKNQIKGAMAYPVAVGILAVLVFLGMTIFLIPVFANIFKGLGTELPELTLFMLGVSYVLTSWMVIIPIGILASIIISFSKYYNTKIGRITIDRLLLKMPILGDLNEKSTVSRFCRIYSTLTRSGVPIITCLEIARDTTSNKVISTAIEKSKQEVQQGGMLSNALEREKVFPQLAIQMISIGEETGELDTMMMKVADFYDDEVEQAVKALTSVLEPIMMVFLAGMVAIILLSMYLPMFKVFDKMG